MALKVGELYASLNLRDQKFHSKLGGAKKALAGIGKAAVAGTAVAGTAMAGAAAKGLSEFKNFEKGMQEVFTLMPDATKDAKNQMVSDIKEFSKEMGVTTKKSVPALYQAISAGVPKKNVFNFMKQAQKAAVAGNTELKTSVDSLSSVVNAYGKDTMSAAKASDAMFTAVKEGKTTFEEMSTKLSKVTPVASSLGVKFGDVTAALATMTKQGTPTSEATTQIRQALNELSKEGTKSAKAFKDIAGKSFSKFIKQGGNMQKAMKLMKKAAKKNDTSIKNLFSSVEAGQAALALTGEGGKEFKRILDETRESAGATDTAYKGMSKTLARALKKIKAAANVLFIEIGEKLAPSMKKFASWINANSSTISNAILTAFDAVGSAIKYITNKIIPKVIKSFNWIKNNIDTVMPAIVGTITAAAIPAFISLASTVAAVAAGITAALSPALLIIGAIGTAAGLMYKKWKKSGGSLNKLISKISNKFTTAFNYVSENILPKFKSAFQSVSNWVKKNLPKVKNTVMTVVNVIKKGFNFVAKTIIPGIIGAFKKFVKFIKTSSNEGAKTFRGFAGKLQTIFNKVLTLINTVATGIKKVFQWMWKQVQKLWKKYGQSIKQYFVKIWTSIVGILDGILDMIIGLLDTFIGLFSGDWEKFNKGLEEIWDGAWKTIKNILEGAWNILKKPLTSLTKKITEEFTSLADTAINWGENILLGLKEGIANKVTDAVQAVKDAVSDVVDGAKEKLGINSPSKVFAEIGQNTAAGMQKGIEKAQPKVKMQIDDMINKATPSGTQSSSAGPNQIINMTVNQHVSDKATAEHANDDLVGKLQGRGVGVAFR